VNIGRLDCSLFCCGCGCGCDNDNDVDDDVVGGRKEYDSRNVWWSASQTMFLTFGGSTMETDEIFFLLVVVGRCCFDIALECVDS
jgi:hypothetical protein